MQHLLFTLLICFFSVLVSNNTTARAAESNAQFFSGKLKCETRSFSSGLKRISIFTFVVIKEKQTGEILGRISQRKKLGEKDGFWNSVGLSPKKTRLVFRSLRSSGSYGDYHFEGSITHNGKAFEGRLLNNRGEPDTNCKPFNFRKTPNVKSHYGEMLAITGNKPTIQNATRLLELEVTRPPLEWFLNFSGQFDFRTKERKFWKKYKVYWEALNNNLLKSVKKLITQDKELGSLFPRIERIAQLSQKAVFDGFNSPFSAKDQEKLEWAIRSTIANHLFFSNQKQVGALTDANICERISKTRRYHGSRDTVFAIGIPVAFWDKNLLSELFGIAKKCAIQNMNDKQAFVSFGRAIENGLSDGKRSRKKAEFLKATLARYKSYPIGITGLLQSNGYSVSRVQARKEGISNKWIRFFFEPAASHLRELSVSATTKEFAKHFESQNFESLALTEVSKECAKLILPLQSIPSLEEMSLQSIKTKCRVASSHYIKLESIELAKHLAGKFIQQPITLSLATEMSNDSIPFEIAFGIPRGVAQDSALRIYLLNISSYRDKVLDNATVEIRKLFGPNINPYARKTVKVLSFCNKLKLPKTLDSNDKFHQLSILCVEFVKRNGAHRLDIITKATHVAQPNEPDTWKSLFKRCNSYSNPLSNWLLIKEKCKTNGEILHGKVAKAVIATFEVAEPFTTSELTANKFCEEIRIVREWKQANLICHQQQRQFGERKEAVRCQRVIDKAEGTYLGMDVKFDIGSDQTMTVSQILCKSTLSPNIKQINFGSEGFIFKTPTVEIIGSQGETRYAAILKSRQTGIGKVYFVSEVRKTTGIFPTSKEPGAVFACVAELKKCR